MPRAAWFRCTRRLGGRPRLAATAVVWLAASAGEQPAWAQETTQGQVDPPGVRVYVNQPAESPPAENGFGKKPTSGQAPAPRLLMYLLPNGNTIEQTLGCRMHEGLDWHFDIQHVLAQTRRLRAITPSERITLLAAEAPGRTWSAFRTTYADGNARMGRLFADWVGRYGATGGRVTLTAHSGGGSFLFGVIESHKEIPACIDRLAWLDANYAYDAALHQDKLVRWLRGEASRRLVVIAYDDREILFEGKKVVGPTGGTFRATQRMVDSLGQEFPLEKQQPGQPAPFATYRGLDGRIQVCVHPNPDNNILHTALVGDMNGLLYAATLGTPQQEAWGEFGGPRAYEASIPPQPIEFPASPRDAEAADPTADFWTLPLPPRPADAVGGAEFCRRIAPLAPDEREAAIEREVLSGNVPPFLRRFVRVPVTGTDADDAPLAGSIEAAPDYLAVGSDADFVRMPLRPQTAQRIADRLDCVLPTRKLVDAIDAAATGRLEPQPLTEDRESVAAFVLANEKIEALRRGHPLGELVTGVKKDVVLTPLLWSGKPRRVAIYGWRRPGGEPIQPLTTVHVDWYVDYSHGLRLVRRRMEVAGRAARLDEALVNPHLAPLVSDEGPLPQTRYDPAP